MTSPAVHEMDPTRFADTQAQAARRVPEPASRLLGRLTLNGRAMVDFQDLARQSTRRSALDAARANALSLLLEATLAQPGTDEDTTQDLAMIRAHARTIAEDLNTLKDRLFPELPRRT